MKICIINEVIPASDFAILLRALQDFVPKVTNAWGLPAIEVSASTPLKGDWRVYITERARHAGASGYHSVESGSPVAYCSPRASGNRTFGTYHPPVFTKKGVQLFPSRFLAGLSYTLSHELAEMIGDPLLETLSSPDGQDRQWLRELCDPVMNSCLTFTDSTGKVVVLADVVLPSFYDLKGVAPFSLANAPTAPFTLSKKGYAYWRNKLGKLVKI